MPAIFTGSLAVTGSIIVTQGVTGSLLGTASYATTASYAHNAASANSAFTASSADNFTVRGTLTAQTIVVQTITSSISVVTGSMTVSGALNVLGGITGSLLGTASFANNATSASYTPSINGTTNYVAKFTSNSAVGNSIIYDNGTNVGIGTTTILDGNGARLAVAGIFPQTPLEVRQDTLNDHYAITLYNSGGLVGAIALTGSDVSIRNEKSTGNITFKTNSVDRVRITSGGSVGIGSLSPTQRLEVVGNTLIGPAGGKMFIGDVGHGTTYPALAHQDYATTTGYAMLVPNNGYLFLNKRDVASTYIGFRKANADLMVISNDGDVGIATTAPSGKLDVRVSGTTGWDRLVVNTTTQWGDGSTQFVTIGAGGATGIMLSNPHVVWYPTNNAAALRLGRSGGVITGAYYEIGTSGNDSFFISKNGGTGSSQLFIDSSGNIGIGTTTPGTKVHIVTNDTGNGVLRLQNINASGYSNIQFYDSSSAFAGSFGWINGTYTAGNINGTNLWDAGSSTRYFLVRGSTLIKQQDVDGQNSLFLLNQNTGTSAYSVIRFGESGDNPTASGRAFIHYFNTNWTSNGYWDAGSLALGTTSGNINFSVGGTNQFKIWINSSQRFTIDSNGKVGINTTLPGARLDVAEGGGVSSNNALALRAGNDYNTSGSNQIIFGYDNTTTYAHAIKTRHQSANAIQNGIDFYTWQYGAAITAQAGQYVMTIAGNGNVGINSTYPAYKLDVYTSGSTSAIRINSSTNQNSQIRLEEASSLKFAITYVPSDSSTRFYFGGSDFITLKGGSVGIGTTAPTQIVEAYQSSNGDVAYQVTNPNTGTASTAQFFASNGTTRTQFFHTGTSYVGTGILNAAGLGGIFNQTTAGIALAASNAAGAIKFSTGTSNTEVMRITGSSIGIGTTIPSTKLHLYESGASDVILRITPADGAYDPLIQLTGQGNNMTEEGFEIWYSNSVGDVHLSTTYPDNAASIHFHTRTGASKSTSNERLTILGGGNVGINTTAPNNRLQVGGGVTATSFTGSLFGTASFAISASWAPVVLSGGTTNYVAKWGSATTLTTGLIYDDGSGVGIGTTTTTAPLTFAASVGEKILLYAAGANYYGMDVQSGLLRIYAGFSPDNIAFGTRSGSVFTENVRIVGSGGAVGIGTTAPATKLQVAGNIGLGSTANGYTEAGSKYIGSSYASPGADGYNGLQIESVNAPAPYNGNYSQNLKFYTHHYAAGTGGTPRMTIQYDGNVGIGVTNPLVKLDVNGSVYVRPSGILYTDTIAGYTTNVVNLQSNTNFIVPSGCIGIGTTAPGNSLHIYGAGTTFARIQAGGGDYAYLRLQTPSSGDGYIIKNTATANGVIDKALYLWNDPGPIQFVPNGNISRAVTINTTGSLLLGTTQSYLDGFSIYPLQLLAVKSTAQYMGVATFENTVNTGDVNHGIINLANTKAYAVGDDARIMFSFRNSDATIHPKASLGAINAGDFAADLQFNTRNTTYTEKMRLSAAGALSLWSGSFNIRGGLGANNSSAYTSANRIIFDNDYNDTARGPNKITLYDSTFLAGFGIHTSTLAYYTGGTHRWYQATNATDAAHLMVLDSGANLGIGTTAPAGKLDVRTGGTSTWGPFIVTSTALWGDGATQYVTIGAGGAAGIMLNNPHVVWNAGNNAAALRMGRSGGVSGGAYYEIGTSGNDSFFISKNSGTGSAQLFINSSGNIGIGTINPSVKLHVAGGLILQNNNGSGNADSGLRLYASCATTHYNWMLGAQYNINAGFEITPSSTTGSTTFSSPVAVFLQSGYVGIGSTAPSSRLTLVDNAPPSSEQVLNIKGTGQFGVGIHISGSSNWRILSTGASSTPGGGFLGFYSDNGTAYRMVISPNGSVGIGTTTFSNGSKFEIAGSGVWDGAVVTLKNTGAGGKTLSVFSTNNLFSQQAGSFLFYNSNEGTNMGVWSGAGNVGIGTGNVNGNKIYAFGDNDGSNQFRLHNNNTGTQAYSEVSVGHGSFRELRLGSSYNYSSAEWNQSWIYAVDRNLALKTDAGYVIKFYTNGTADANEKVRISVSGSLLIGDTASPSEFYWKGTAIFGQNGVNKVIIGQLRNTTITGAMIGGHNSALTDWADLNVMGGNVILGYAQTEVMRVTTGGNVGIGTTSPSYKLDVTGTIRATGDIIAYSDARVKTNINTIENALEKIKLLRGVSYNRIDTEDKSEKIGVIAQEVLEILPQVVQQDDNGNYSVAYGNIVGVLIEAIKEQQRQIDDLKYLLQTQTK